MERSEGRDQRSGGFRISDCGFRILFGLLKRFTHRYLANSEIRHPKSQNGVVFLNFKSEIRNCKCTVMDKHELERRTKKFAVSVIRLVEDLPKNRTSEVLPG